MQRITGAVFVLSIWLMVLSAVLLGGTLFGAVLIRRRTQATQARAPVPGCGGRRPDGEHGAQRAVVAILGGRGSGGLGHDMDTGVRERAFDGRQWWSRSLPGHGVRRVRELNLATHVLALSAQQVLCTAPLVVALSAVLQRVTGRGVGAVLSRFFGLHGAAAADMTALFKGSETVSTTVLLIGLLVAVGFAASVAATLQRGFELMWGLPHAGGLRSLARQLGWAVSLPGYVVGVIFAGRAGRTVGHLVSLGLPMEVLLQVLLTLLFHWWGQHVLLSGRVCWRHLVPGALTVALATLVLVKLSNLVLPGQIDEQVADYGLIGAVFVLSIWLMVLSAVLLGGTLFGAVLIQRRAQATQARAPVPGAEDHRSGPGRCAP